jgi:hypothetical protein
MRQSKDKDQAKILEDNQVTDLLNDIFYKIQDSRKEKAVKELEQPELPEDLKNLENKKRARYEAILDKYKD